MLEQDNDLMSCSLFYTFGELYYQVQHFKGIKEFIQSPTW